MERWGIVLGDLHCGSIWGLRPPQHTAVESEDEITIGPVGQDLHAGFQERVKRYGSPDFLIVTGDTVEGLQRKDRSKWLWTPDPMQQAEAAIPFIDAWNAGVVFGVQGTKYHVEEGMNADEYVMRHVERSADLRGRHAPPDWYVNVAGAVIHVSHKIGGTSVFQYRGTPLSRELAMNRVMSYVHEVHKCNLILRGHVHHYFEVRAGGNSRCVAVPAWKCRDDWCGLNHPFTWMPHLGVLVVVVKNGKVVCCEPDLFDFPQQRPPLQELDDWLQRFGRLADITKRPAMPPTLPEWLQSVAPAAAA